jgi:hypothetical protein
MYWRAYAVATRHWEDDFYVVTRICHGHKAHMGRNARLCEEAQINIGVFPWQQALVVVVQHTYLCGDTPCGDLVHTLVSTVYGLCLAVVVVLMTGCSAMYVAGRRRLLLPVAHLE